MLREPEITIQDTRNLAVAVMRVRNASASSRSFASLSAKNHTRQRRLHHERSLCIVVEVAAGIERVFLDDGVLHIIVSTAAISDSSSWRSSSTNAMPALRRRTSTICGRENMRELTTTRFSVAVRRTTSA